MVEEIITFGILKLKSSNFKATKVLFCIDNVLVSNKIYFGEKKL